MKIVVLDCNTLGELDFTELKSLGQVIFYDRTDRDEIAERVKDADVIITNKVNLNESNLKDAKNLKLICLTATGFNNIDIKYAKSKGIGVANVAGYSTDTVAQHTFALLLNLYDKIDYYDSYIKRGDYSKSITFTHMKMPFHDVSGKVWGIIGLGAIGRKVAEIAKAFGAKVQYYSTSGNNNNSDYEQVSLDKLLKTSDIVSIHAPLNEGTMGLINYDNIKKMKNSAVLINVGRGPIVVEEDLAKAIDEDLIEGAGLDVFAIEPLPEDNPLLAVTNKHKLVLTPHIAWASVEARNRLLKEVIENIRAYSRKEIRNRVEL